MMKGIVIFTDGASRGNPGSGGWGAIVAMDGKVTELGGGDRHTTNNRMEMSAVIHSLKFVSRHLTRTQHKVTINLDSSYVLNGATRWIHGWQKTGWKTKNKKYVLNKDLWVKLGKVTPELDLEWKLLKGHSGISANERCDVIATSFADGKKPKLYSGTHKNYGVDFSISDSKSISYKLKTKSLSAKAYSYVSQVNGIVKIHSNWAECEKRVKGVSGAKFKKSFSVGDEQKIITEFQNI